MIDVVAEAWTVTSMTTNETTSSARARSGRPGTKCCVHTIKAGVTVRWADGPSYHSVVGLLHAAGGQRSRAERKLSLWLLAAAVIRATIFPHW